ncbi:MAG: DNA primase [candidate division WS2 bacterium]|nr:DNA primase [Candidatus Psychracetigena formicireducens]
MLIDDIKSRLNIIELAKSEGLQLKKQSNRIYKTTCCFHNEKKASLTFYADTNTFNCFACQAHGDAINFYAKRHGIDNKEAIKQLAGHLGLQTSFKGLKADLMAIGGQRGLKNIGEALKGKERQFKQDPDPIYRALQEFCEGIDQETETYLTSQSRGLTDETIKKFGIFSIKDYKKTKEFLLSKFKLETLQDLVLINRRQNRFLFTMHKIIIPVIEDGKIKAIRGRFFYKGFSDPDVFTKTYTYGKYQSTAGVANRLFNGDILKTLKKGERVYLVEGEFDTMILDQHGYNAVGVLGVSNYDEDTIKRLNDFDLQICFDNDEQGKKEADKVARIFNRQTGRLAYFETALKDAGVKDITELFIKRAKEKK